MLHNVYKKTFNGVNYICMSQGSMKLLKGRRLNRYVLDKPINCGRYGTVYHALDTKTGAERAVKLLPRTRHDVEYIRNMKNIRTEVANMWRARGHPNVVYLHDMYKDDDNYYIVQELCGGDNVQSLLGTAHPTKFVQRLISDVAMAIRHVHGKDILFIDVKPQNIIYSTEHCKFKLTDFGSSYHITPGKLLHSSEVICTPLFASPEVITHTGEVTDKHDSWALGVLLFWLLSGHHPFLDFDSSTPQKLLDAISHQKPSFHELPIEARGLVEQLLIKDPSERLTVDDLMAHEWLTPLKV